MSIIKRKEKGKIQYRFQVYYTLPDGSKKRKCSRWYPTKTEAVQAEKEFIRTIPLSAADYLTFGQLKTLWLKEYENSEKNTSRTIREKESILNRRFSDWYDMPLSELTPLKIKQRLEEPDIAGLSTSSKNKYRNILHSIFQYGVKFFELSRNPLDVIDTYSKTQAEKEKQKQIYSPQDFFRFVQAVEDPEYQKLFTFVYWLGLRRSEALSLTFGDLHGDVLLIHRQWNISEKKWTKLKTASSNRALKLPFSLLEIVDEQKKRYSSAPGYNDEWFLFGGFHPLTTSGMDRQKKKALELSGLPYITNHELRHSFVSMMLMKEKPFAVSRSVGHSSTDITERVYGHLQNNISDLSETIETMFQEAKKKI